MGHLGGSAAQNGWMKHGILVSPALLLWLGLVALKLLGWRQHWRQHQARALGQAFQAELLRRERGRAAGSAHF